MNWSSEQKFVGARLFSLPENIVNVEGGAVAYGHPNGAPGAMLTARLLYSMKRDGLWKGVVTLCTAGIVLEAVR